MERIFYGRQNDGSYLPTPEEIRNECLRIQSNWTKRIAAERAVCVTDRKGAQFRDYRRPRVETQVCSTAFIRDLL